MRASSIGGGETALALRAEGWGGCRDPCRGDGRQSWSLWSGVLGEKAVMTVSEEGWLFEGFENRREEVGISCSGERESEHSREMCAWALWKV